MTYSAPGPPTQPNAWPWTLSCATPTAGKALETLHLDGAYCVGYREVFEAGELTMGAYQCYITLSDPGGWTLTPGGPGGAWQAPSPRPVPAPAPAPPTWASAPVLEAPETVATLGEASGWVRFGQAVVRLLEVTSVPLLTAALVLMPLTANAPGLPPPLYPPATPKDRLRLEELERLREARALTSDEKAEYLLLLARVRGVHLGEDPANSLAEALEQAKKRARYTLPSRLVSASARPRGRITAIPLNVDEQTRNGLTRENESAVLLAQAGYDVEQNPVVPGLKKPDYLDRGEDIRLLRAK